ncbi:MAG TPA: response regulator transcription factor [Allosphingosinicella sp.]|nr:response regulator transcription factor [Allosphingosinicella sp.]
MIRLLLADDHPLMLSGIEAMLRGTAYEVVAKANDGVAALEAIPGARPDILVLDLKMPLRNGLDVLRTLRARGDQRPIVILTADLDDQSLMEAIQLGVNGIIMKEGAENLIVTCLDHVARGERWIERSVLQRALDITLRDGAEPRGALGALAPRERAISRLVGAGLRNREIADELGLSEGTVKVCLHRIYEKLEISNRTELAMLARELAD